MIYAITDDSTPRKMNQFKISPFSNSIFSKVLKMKIDGDKNPQLAEALRVKGLPTLMIYKGGEMVWRQSGEQDANTLISLMNEYID